MLGYIMSGLGQVRKDRMDYVRLLWC